MSLPQFDKQKEFALTPIYPPPIYQPARPRNPWPVAFAFVLIGLMIGRYYLPHQQRYTIYGDPPIRMDHETGNTWKLHNGIWETLNDDTQAWFDKTIARFEDWERRHPEDGAGLDELFPFTVRTNNIGHY